MKIDHIPEAEERRTICIYPGRFQPPHIAHAKTYAALAKKYGAQNTFIATSNKTDGDKSPFDFAEKKQLLVAAGVPASQIVQAVNVYAAKEITDNFDPNTTIVLYAVGAKDMQEDPRFKSFVKKDGSPAYLQPLEGQKVLDSYATHSYLVVAPTVQFSIDGKPATSASEVRQMFKSATPEEQSKLAAQLYGKNAAKVLPILQRKLQPVDPIVKEIDQQYETFTKSALNKPTPTVKELAAKYRVTIQKINHALGQGIKVEMEHTMDVEVAREIALDHLGEKLDYYTLLRKVEKEAAPSGTVIGDRQTALNPDDRGAHWLSEDILDEANLKAIRGFADDPRLENVKMGWELEMIWPDHDDGRDSDDDYESESEPDWDADEGINHSSVGSFRRDISNFFVGDHNSTRDVRGALDDFLEDYREHLAEKWNELYDDEDEETRDEVVSRMQAGTDEDTAKDEARDEWISNNEDEMLEDYVENDRGITSMQGFMSEGPGDLNWPYWTEPEYGYGGEKGSLTREDLKNMFIEQFGDMLRQDGYRVEAINSPHKNKRLDTWYFEPDGSLSPQDRDEGGVELTTPPIPYKRSMEYLEKVFAWAKSNRAWTGKEGDTGFHMSFSLPKEEMGNVDWVKLILMGGDDRVLRDFDRWANGENGWAKSALKHIRTAAANNGDLNSDMIIKAIRDGLTPDAKREAMKYMSRGKYTSVHPKGAPDDGDPNDFTYVEFRSAGGDALGQLDKVQTAALQYARAITLAADPNAERQEYAKKLYKLVAKVKADDPGLRALQQFAAGKIDKETLKYTLAKAATARGQKPKYQPTGNMYVFAAGGSAKDRTSSIEIIAPTLLSAIPKAMAAANEKQVSHFYFKLVTDPTERVFSVETEDRLEGTDRRAGMLVVAQDGAQAAQTVSDMLGLPVNSLLAIDRTNAYDLEDMGRWIKAKWTTKEQVDAARQEAEKAAAEKAAAEKQARAAGAKTYNIVTSQGGRPAYPPATHTQLAISPEEAVAKFMAANMIGSVFRNSYNAVPAAPATTGEPRSVFQRDPQPPTAQSQAGTYIITYLPPVGNQQQTAYDANSEEEAVSLFHVQHPASYRLLDVTRHEETPQSESFIRSTIGRAILENELDEVNMSPGALADFAKTDAAKRIRVGWEAEMLVPDMSDSEPQWDDDLEPNWDENRTIRFDRNWRTQIQDFWRDGDYNSESRRSIERAVEEMDEQYQEHVDDQLADYLESEEGIAALMASIRENEAGTEDLSDEEISELDDYANFLESATDDVRDRWTSEYLSDDSNFVDWAENNSLDDMIGFSNRFELSWPYQTPVSRGGSVDMASLSKEFSKFSGYPTKVGSYSTRPDDQTGVFKTDSSIKLLDLPDNYSGVEFASAYLPYDESVDMLNKFYKWAGDIGAETNESCGFHMGISIPGQNASNVDVLKFVLFLGDNKVLKDFGREASTWTKSTIDKMKSMSLTGGNKYESALAAMKQGLNAAATAQIKNTALPVSSDRGGDRYMSVNYKSDYIEVRSAGGNVFEMKDKILETMNRYVRVLALAADPEAEKQEYAKKLYKLLSTGVPGEEDTIRYFSQYAAGTLPSTALKSFVRQAQRKRADKNKPAASDWTIYKILRRADDFEVHEFLATDAIQAQETLERWARAGGMDSEDYTVVKANQQPNQQSSDDDVDFGHWEPEPEPQRPTNPNAWSPSARIAYQLVDRNGSNIATFSDGVRMPSNGLFYAANSDDAGRRAAELDRLHGLPMGYLVRPFGQNPHAYEPAAIDEPEEPAVSNMWDVWFMHQDPDDEGPSEISNRVRADSAQAAMAAWDRRHPRSPALRVTPSNESISEAKGKPKKPKTIVDGAIKTLVSKGRSEDEAIADLKKEVDKKFYTEGEEISETLKKVNGKWALVSRHDPKKVLQYYHGSGHPSKEWVSKVERRVHSFSEAIEDTKHRVYVDMDGVLADFFGQWTKMTGVDHWKDIKNVDTALQDIRKHPTFWTDLKMLPHAKQLIKTIVDNFGEYYICSTPLAGDSRSEPGKRAWINQHLQDHPPAGIIFTHNKAANAMHDDVPSILIDDYGVNISSWKAAGGIGLQYEDKPTGSNFDHVKKMLEKLAK